MRAAYLALGLFHSFKMLFGPAAIAHPSVDDGAEQRVIE
jgi:hypothetical protein